MRCRRELCELKQLLRLWRSAWSIRGERHRPGLEDFDQLCRLEDRLSGLLHQEQHDVALGVQHLSAERQAIKILLFGDSVEQFITRHICSHFTEEADNLMSIKDSHAHFCAGHRWNCAGCSTHGFILAREASHGVLTTYGWQQGLVNSTLSLAERVSEVFCPRAIVLCGAIILAAWILSCLMCECMSSYDIHRMLYTCRSSRSLKTLQAPLTL